MSARSQRGAEAGVTLPETLIALTILLVVTVSILSLFSYAMKLNATGRHYAQLTQCARDTAEHLLALPWTDPQLAAGAHSGGADVNENQLIWRVSDSRVDESAPVPLVSSAFGEANLKEITITCVAGLEAGIGRRDVTVVALKVKE